MSPFYRKFNNLSLPKGLKAWSQMFPLNQKFSIHWSWRVMWSKYDCKMHLGELLTWNYDYQFNHYCVIYYLLSLFKRRYLAPSPFSRNPYFALTGMIVVAPNQDFWIFYGFLAKFQTMIPVTFILEFLCSPPVNGRISWLNNRYRGFCYNTTGRTD